MKNYINNQLGEAIEYDAADIGLAWQNNSKRA